MGRKSHYISVDDLKIKDKIFLNMLRCSGYASQKQCLNLISSNRLKNYVLEKVIDKCSVIINGKSETVYRFSDNGKEWVKENVSDLSDRNFYSSTGVEHDLRLMDKIQEIGEKLPYEEQLKFRTEIENRDLFKELCQNMEQSQYYSNDIKRYEAALTELEAELDECMNNTSTKLKWIEHFKMFENISEIDRNTVIQLIMSIHIYDKTHLQITFNYEDEYEKALATLEEIKEAV